MFKDYIYLVFYLSAAPSSYNPIYRPASPNPVANGGMFNSTLASTLPMQAWQPIAQPTPTSTSNPYV